MAAGMSGLLAGRRHALRLRLLGDPGQRVELRKDADDWFAGSVARHEAGRHAGDAGLDAEPGVPKLLLQQHRALRLLIADFREVPDLQRRPFGLQPVLVDSRRDGGLVVLRARGCGHCRDARRGERVLPASCHDAS
jgi:hypothetical protein